MCKIVAFTNGSKIKKSGINKIGNILLKLEKDGFGYAMQGEQGPFGEKCIADTFESRLNATNVVELPIVAKRYEAFGTASAVNGPALFHGRTSTNVRGLRNCHPMQRDGWNLIHNGVVTDYGPYYLKDTSNDSEDVLKRLIDGIDHVEKHLSGYYAFAAIAPDAKLHVCRDDLATLYVAWSPVLESYIIATTESLLDDVSKALKAKRGPIEYVEDETYMIWEGNELVACQEIVARGYTSIESKYSGASIGKVIDATGGTLSSAMADGFSVTDDGLSINQRFNRMEDDETRYYAYKREVEAMGPEYEIWDGDAQLTLAEFRKLDHISQESCVIIRPDGTWLTLEYNDGEAKSVYDRA